jgi:hypothetical protein
LDTDPVEILSILTFEFEDVHPCGQRRKPQPVSIFYECVGFGDFIHQEPAVEVEKPERVEAIGGFNAQFSLPVEQRIWKYRE